MSHQCDPRYECVHFEAADELLRAIAPVPSLETKTFNPEFIFRGQGCASWNLTPSALRKDPTGKSVALAHIASGQLRGTAEDQVFAEFTLLKSFIEMCDRAVILLPDDSYAFRQAWMDDQNGPTQRAYRDPTTWPFSQHLPLLAFAQHHGVPTRLLDWTRNPTVAAYFAVAGHVNTHDGELAIWALNVEFIHLYSLIELVPMPGANSHRLGAQRGLFTITRPKIERGVLIDLDRLTFADALNSPNEDLSRPKPLWKLTLPHSEALRLLYLCHLNGVDAAFVYPGPDGAAKATIERAAWQRAGVSAIRLDAPKIKSQRC